MYFPRKLSFAATMILAVVPPVIRLSGYQRLTCTSNETSTLKKMYLCYNFFYIIYIKKILSMDFFPRGGWLARSLGQVHGTITATKRVVVSIKRENLFLFSMFPFLDAGFGEKNCSNRFREKCKTF